MSKRILVVDDEADVRRFLTAVEELYADLDATIAARGPVCLNRGSCCRFGRFVFVGDLPDDLLDHVLGAIVRHRRPVVLEQQMEHLIAMAQLLGHHAEDPELLFLVLGARQGELVLLDTGARLSEIANLRTEDVDLERGVFRVMGKGTQPT